MALFPICFNRIFDDLCDPFFEDKLDFFDPCDCFNVFPSTSCIRPTIRRCVIESKPFQHSANNTIDNEKRLQPQTQPVNSPNNTINDKKNLEPTVDATHPEKFSIHLNVAGYDSKTIKTKFENGKLIIEANQEDRRTDGDYNIRQFRKTYELPKQADATRMTTHVTPNAILVIEMPMRNSEDEDRSVQADNKKKQSLTQSNQHRDSLSDYINLLINSEFHPRIVDKDKGARILEMTIDTKNCLPEEINVSVKNNELIVRGEHKLKESHHSKRSRFFKSTTLPAGAQVSQMQTQVTNDGQLKIEVPLD